MKIVLTDIPSQKTEVRCSEVLASHEIVLAASMSGMGHCYGFRAPLRSGKSVEFLCLNSESFGTR